VTAHIAGRLAAVVIAVLVSAGTGAATAADRDRDGLSDRFERTRSHTSAHRRDTDGDRLSDRYELRRSRTSPRRQDTDRDGLTDGYEIRRVKTNPRKADTDRDGLSDGAEVFPAGGLSSSVLPPATDPRKRDTDGDGLSDGYEVRKSRTNPVIADTDGDGYSDGVEVQHGWNPLDASSPGQVADPPPPPPPAPLPDVLPPDTAITAGPSGTVAATDASFEFTSTEPGTFECRRDSGSWHACSSPKTYTGLAAGPHHFDVRATDSAGNVDPIPATREWTIQATADTTPPETTVTSGPTGTVGSSSAALSFSSSESGSTFECRIDGAAYASCSSPKAYVGLSDGQHTFSVRATDAAGNTDASAASRTWTVDTSAPDTSISSGPSDPSTATSASFAFASPEPGVGYDCKLDAGAWAACSSPKAYSGLAAGPHTFSVRARDAAGNVDATPATATWQVIAPPDTTPPDTSITSGPSGTATTASASFGFNSSEQGSTFECDLDGSGYGACTSPKSYSSLADGQHTFSVRASDTAGNTDPTAATRTWTVDTSPPPPPPPPPPPGTCTQTVSSAAAAQSAVNSAGAGTVVCLTDGTYGALSLSGSHPAPGVTLTAANPGNATIGSTNIAGDWITLSHLNVRGTIQIDPGSEHTTVEYSDIRGGDFGIDAGPTTSEYISDTTVRGNRFVGPFEDAFRLNRYHDGSDADTYGILIEGNEITGVIEDGRHNDCLQSVWGGDHLYFRRNYEHDNRCQGFFVKDQPAIVDTVILDDNLFVRNSVAAPGVGQPHTVNVYNLSNFVATHNTVWPGNGSAFTLRAGPWGPRELAYNVIQRLWTDSDQSALNEHDNVFCDRQTGTGGTLPPLGPGSQVGVCSPSFSNTASDDYRVIGANRGVTWRPADQHYGP
jgi:Bacterial TSP3 repeat